MPSPATLHETGRLVAIAVISAAAALLVAGLPSIFGGTDASARSFAEPAPLVQLVDLAGADSLSMQRPRVFTVSDPALDGIAEGLAGFR